MIAPSFAQSARLSFDSFSMRSVCSLSCLVASSRFFNLLVARIWTLGLRLHAIGKKNCQPASKWLSSVPKATGLVAFYQPGECQGGFCQLVKITEADLRRRARLP